MLVLDGTENNARRLNSRLLFFIDGNISIMFDLPLHIDNFDQNYYVTYPFTDFVHQMVTIRNHLPILPTLADDNSQPFADTSYTS